MHRFISNLQPTAILACRLLNHHPYVLSFYTILLTRSFVVIVMEYAPGGTLACYISSLLASSSCHSSSKHHRRISGQPSTLSSTITGTNTHTDVSMHSDYSHSGRHSQQEVAAERQRLATVRTLFQQMITLLEYVQLCGIALGEFQPQCFMVAFQSDKHGNPVPSLRLSHFGNLHSEHPTQAVRAHNLRVYSHARLVDVHRTMCARMAGSAALTVMDCAGAH